MDNSLHAVTGAVEGKAKQQLKLGSSTVAYGMWIANMLNKCSVDLEPFGCLVACESEKWKSHCRNLPKYYRAVLDTDVRSSLHSESVVSTGWERPEAGDVPERWGSWSLQRREGCASLVGRFLVDLGQKSRHPR